MFHFIYLFTSVYLFVTRIVGIFNLVIHKLLKRKNLSMHHSHKSAKLQILGTQIFIPKMVVETLESFLLLLLYEHYIIFTENAL